MTDIAGERALLSAQGLDIVTRETWNAVQTYTSDRDVFEPVEGFVLHISVTADPADTPAAEAAACRTVESIGQQRFGIGCSYNAGTMQSGRLYEMQPLTRRGAHTVDDKNVGYRSTGSSRSMNYWWRACVLVQNVNDPVTDAQVDSAARWAAAQIRAGYARRDAIWIGHRDVAFKSCPGDEGYARLPEIRALTAHYVTHGLDPQPVPQREDTDMLIVKAPDQEIYYLLHSGKMAYLGAVDDIRELQTAGIPTFRPEPRTWDAFNNAYPRRLTTEMPREPSLGELADDVTELRTEVKVLAAKFDDAPFVRRDLHQSEYGRVRDDIASLRTLTMWTLAVLSSSIIGAIVVLVVSVARSGG